MKITALSQAIRNGIDHRNLAIDFAQNRCLGCVLFKLAVGRKFDLAA